MSTPVNSIISKCGTMLNDASNVRWSASELLGYLNSGQRQIVQLKPEANVQSAIVTLVAGTRQSLPSGAYQLVGIDRNISADGTTPGNAITLASKDVLDQTTPGWHTDATSAVVSDYMYDIQTPTVFWVYPPQPAVSPGSVQLNYSAPPADAAIGGNITLNDIYEPSLVDYILYRAYEKDIEFAAEANLASLHYNAFLGSLGIFNKQQLLRNPNLQNTPINPQAPAAAR